MKSIIRNFIAKMVAGRSDDGIMITLKDPKKVDFQTAMMEDLLMRNGIDPSAIKSEAQLKGLLNQIDAMTKQSTTTSGIRNTESAKVFDLEGKEIPKGSKIIGGKAVDDDLPPPGSRGGPDDIAAPVQSQEETLRNMTEAEIKREIEENNKSAVKKILERKNREDVYGLEDYDTTNMSEIKKEIIRTETKLGNLNPDDPGFREKAKPLVDKITELQKKLRDDKADGGRIGLKDGVPPVKMPDPLERILKNMTAEERANFELMMKINASRMPKYKPDPNAIPPVPMPTYPREDRAEGGIMRLGLKEGSGMTRRTFLKFLAGAASIPIVGKIFKPLKMGKTVTKVPIIKTADVAGKPEWFDQLVNKVILEGDEVTKRFATKDREIVHMKKIDDDNTVMVYQDLDEGAVRIDYDAPTNMGEDTVSLEYKKPLPDEGAPNPKAEFQATETEPRYVGGPEDADIEFDAVGGGSDIRMIESDVSKLKEYATGKGPTMKEFIQSKKRKDAVKAINEDQLEQAEYIAGKYGDGPEPPDELMDLFDDEQVTTADKIDRPERAIEKEAIDDFMKRNPMAGGGMLVQPGFGGTRQGYAKVKKKDEYSRLMGLSVDELKDLGFTGKKTKKVKAPGSGKPYSKLTDEFKSWVREQTAASPDYRRKNIQFKTRELRVINAIENAHNQNDVRHIIAKDKF
jgi:hypothetical protein